MRESYRDVIRTLECKWKDVDMRTNEKTAVDNESTIITTSLGQVESRPYTKQMKQE